MRSLEVHGKNGEGKPRAAAFYDMDGTLVRTNLVHSYLFNAWNSPSIARTVLRTAGGIARIPAFLAVDKLDRVAFNEMLYALYDGEYEDRLLELAEDHFEEVLKPNIYPGAYELIEKAKGKGLHQVIISGSLDFVVAPLVRHLGLDDLITNKLEFRRGVATGRIVPPIVAGASKARIIQEYARRAGIDILESYGFSDSYSDYPMLAVLGRPAAVHPDRELRRAARTFDWPILDLS
ncbi:MAG: HAD-IB family hydrolase [Deltaproteobacteria bacterium]|nr:HAD-IB family hydrolase [Deltaproteobacteria bacterium]